jgi:hypothetical protein
MLARNAVLLCTAVIAFCIGLLQPMYNWDIIGYTACAHYDDGLRGVELRDRTYADIRREVDPQRYGEITHGKYDGVVFENPRALEQHVPLYSIRVVYVGMMHGLHALGVEYPRTTYLIAATFGALSVLMLGAVTAAAGMPVAIVPLAALGAGLGDLGRLSTPDTLTLFFALWAAYCLLKGNRLLFLASALLPLMRTDAAVLSALLMAFAFWRGERVLSVASFAISAAAYVVINRTHGNYGWVTLFNQSLIQISPFPGEIVPSTRVWDYVQVYLLTWEDVVTLPNFLTPILVVSIAVFFLNRRSGTPLLYRYVFFWIPLAYAALRLALYPAFESRYFCFPAVMLLAGALGTLYREFAARRPVA